MRNLLHSKPTLYFFAFLISVIATHALSVSPYIIPSISDVPNAQTQVSLLSPINNQLLLNHNLTNMGYSIIRSPGTPLLCAIFVNSQLVLTTNPAIGASQATFSINEGTNSWYASCTDNQTTATSSPGTFILDTNAPVITLPQSQIYSNDGNAQLSFSATDTIDTSLNCNLYINNQLVQSIVAQSNALVTQSFTNLSSGNYGWNVSCADDTANVGNSALGQLIVSTSSAPFLSITSNKNTYHVGEQGYFLINAPSNATLNLFITTPGGLILRQFVNQVWPSYDLINFLNFTGNYVADIIYFQGQLTAHANVTFQVVSTLSVNLDLNESNFGVDDQVTMRADASGATGLLTYLWDYGDGATESGSGFLSARSHRYTTPGEKVITIHVQDATGSVSSDQQTIHIRRRYPLTVNVYDSIAQIPLSDATVEIEGGVGLTNSEGKAVINAFEGLHDLEVNKNEYNTFSERIAVNEAKTITVFLTRGVFNHTNHTQVRPLNLTPAPNPETPQSQEAPTSAEVNGSHLPALDDFDAMYKKIQERLDQVKDLDDKQKEVAKLIDYETVLKRQLEILNRIRRDEAALSQFKGNKEERKEEIIKNYEGIKQTTIVDFTIKESNRKVRITSSNKITEIIDEVYAKELKTIKNKAPLVKEISKLQGQVEGETGIWILQITTLNGESSTVGVLLRVLRPGAKLDIPIQGIQWYERVGADMIDSVNVVEGAATKEKKDLVFPLGTTGEIVYMIQGTNEISSLEAIVGIALPQWEALANVQGLGDITGHSVWSGIMHFDGLKVILQIVIIIVLLGVYLMYQFDLWEKWKAQAHSFKGLLAMLPFATPGEMQQAKQKIAECFELIEKKKDLQKASEVYKDVMQRYNKLASKNKSRIYTKTQELYYELSVRQGLEWAEQAKIYIKYGKMEAAHEHYEKIRQIYPGLPKQYRATIKSVVDDLLALLQMKGDKV